MNPIQRDADADAEPASDAQSCLCIYHACCADGFGAAWAVRAALGPIDLRAAAYGSAPPDVTGRTVYIVDFSYPREQLIAMAAVATHITILDHHKTAQADLIELPANVTAVFDMNHSGARLAWEHFFPARPLPKLLCHIEDRDLWRFSMDGTREVTAGLDSYPYDFNSWDRFACEPSVLHSEGATILRKQERDLAELLPLLTHRMQVAGYDVPAANLPPTLRSEAGSILAQGEPFGVVYWNAAEHRHFSLRSSDDGLDVSAIAKQFGGGGHRHAASFRLPVDSLP